MTTRAPHEQHSRSIERTDDLDTDLRTYVLDTSVLLSDPRAFFRFAEHNVVIPVVVITGKDMTSAEREALNGGVQRVIQKGSLSRDALLAEVRGLVARATKSLESTRRE